MSPFRFGAFEAIFDGLPRKEGDAILLVQDSRVPLEFFAFDSEYVERLRNGDRSTEHHFVAYFEQLLRIKLRARTLAADKVEDLRQETFIRVIAALRREGGVRQPERFGAFVNSICNNVLLEYYRSSAKNQQMAHGHSRQSLGPRGYARHQASYGARTPNPRGNAPKEPKEKDRKLLRAIFLEEKDKEAVCREFGVGRDYLRVLLHWAKDKFKALYEKDQMRMIARPAIH